MILEFGVFHVFLSWLGFLCLVLLLLFASFAVGVRLDSGLSREGYGL